MGSKNTNPKKIPCSKADVEKARESGRADGHEEMAALIFMALMDHFGWTPAGSDPCPACGSTWAKVSDQRFEPASPSL